MTLSQSINYNQVLADLIAAKKWFEIENYYQENKDSIDNEFVKLWYIAETGNAFNRPIDAITAYEQLLDKNLLKMNYPLLFQLFGQPVLQLCADVQEYSKGEDICQKMIDIVKKDTVVDSSSRSLNIQGLTQSIESFKSFSGKYPKLQLSENKGRDNAVIRLIPHTLSDGIYFNSQWNGISLRTHFDTGAGVGGYIWNRTIAEKIGVKLNTADTITMNGNSLRGFMGVVDSLKLGPFCINAVPVFVCIETIDSSDYYQVKCDSILNSKFDIVLGTPIIKQLGIIEFDFTKNTMSFPPKGVNAFRRNLYIKNSTLFMNMKVCSDDFLTFFDTGWRSGLSINAEFYNKHKNQITTADQATPVKGATGGCNKSSFTTDYEYKCPQIDIQIGDLDMVMNGDCSVSKDNDNDLKLGTVEGGILGCTIFNYCKKAIFDFNNMVFRLEE